MLGGSRSRVGLLALVALSTAVLAAIPLHAPSSPIPVGDSMVSVQLFTDRWEPLSGGVAEVSTATSRRVVVTGATGQSPWVALEVDSALNLTLGEVVTPTGTAIGMIESFVPPVMAGSGRLATVIERTQPLAVPVHLVKAASGINNLLPPDGDYCHWKISVPEGSGLNFTMRVASLLDEAAVDQYMSYRGVSTAERYVRGLVAVVPHVQLGTSGILVGIDLLGELADGVVADCYNITSPSKISVLGPPLKHSLAVVHNGVAYVAIAGAVRKGQLAILLRETGSPSQTIVVSDNPPDIVIPDDMGAIEFADVDCADCPKSAHAPGVLLEANVNAEVLVADCIPEPPEAPLNWDCEPPIPEPDGRCPGPPAPVGDKECKLLRQGSPPFCLSPGEETGVQIGESKSMKVTFQVQGADGMPLSTTGGFEYGWESSRTRNQSFTAPAGANGLGQCIRWFKYTKICVQGWGIPTDLPDTYFWTEAGPIVIFNDCLGVKNTATPCETSYTTSSVCDRCPSQPCPPAD